MSRRLRLNAAAESLMKQSILVALLPGACPAAQSAVVWQHVCENGAVRHRVLRGRTDGSLPAVRGTTGVALRRQRAFRWNGARNGSSVIQWKYRSRQHRCDTLRTTRTTGAANYRPFRPRPSRYAGSELIKHDRGLLAVMLRSIDESSMTTEPVIAVVSCTSMQRCLSLQTRLGRDRSFVPVSGFRGLCSQIVE